MKTFQLKISMPTEVEYIINCLYEYGYEAFIVGGCVRDCLINKIPTDWDITTDATPEVVKDIFTKKGIRVIETGIKHGTITILLNKENYEITTYRVEGEYKDNRRPSEVYFTHSLQEDLQRRDFTINALAYNNKDGLIDLHDGIADLRNKIIKTVGDSDKRFEEDALRMLRAIRFSTVLEFQIHPEISDSILKKNSLIKNISIERIRDEFLKILLSKKPSEGIRRLCELKLLNYIIPELYLNNEIVTKSMYNYNNVFNDIMRNIDNVECNVYQRLSVLLYQVNNLIRISNDNISRADTNEQELPVKNMVTRILKRLKFDNYTVKKVNILITYLNIDLKCDFKEEIKWFIIKVGEDNLEDLFKLKMVIDFENINKYNKILNLQKYCNEILINREPLYISDLNIDGSDLISLGIEKGKSIGDTLNYLLGEVIKNPEINTKDKLILLSKKYCKC